MKKLIRNNTFETNSSSCHSLTFSSNLDYESFINKPLDIDKYKDHSFIYRESYYQDEMDIESVEQKLSVICDHLLSEKKLDDFIKYLKDNYNITIIINSKFLNTNKNPIWIGDYIENEDKNSTNEVLFYNLSFEEYAKIIFNEGIFFEYNNN